MLVQKALRRESPRVTSGRGRCCRAGRISVCSECGAIVHVLVLERVRLELDPVRFLWKFDPAGREFNPAERAELRIRYNDAESGFLARELEFDVWRQERLGDPLGAHSVWAVCA